MAVVVSWQWRELLLKASQADQQALAEAWAADAFAAVSDGAGAGEDDRVDRVIVLFLWSVVHCRGPSAALRPTRRK